MDKQKYLKKLKNIKQNIAVKNEKIKKEKERLDSKISYLTKIANKSKDIIKKLKKKVVEKDNIIMEM